MSAGFAKPLCIHFWRSYTFYSTSLSASRDQAEIWLNAHRVEAAETDWHGSTVVLPHPTPDLNKKSLLTRSLLFFWRTPSPGLKKITLTTFFPFFLNKLLAYWLITCAFIFTVPLTLHAIHLVKSERFGVSIWLSASYFCCYSVAFGVVPENLGEKGGTGFFKKNLSAVRITNGAAWTK